MYCSNCGNELSDDSRFCEYCGSAVEEEQEQQEPRVGERAPALKARLLQALPLKEGTPSKIIVYVAAIAVIAVGVWLLVGLLDKDEPAVHAPTPNSAYAETGSNGESSNSATEQDRQGSQENEGEYDVSGIEGIEDVDDEYITNSLSTYDRPTPDEFSWYDEVFSGGVWSDATPITELAYMLGGWKCYIVYDPYVNGGSEARELANVSITAEQSGMKLVVDWYQMLYNGEPTYDETDMEDSVFTGKYENNEFYLTGPGNITLGEFYEYQGKYYGFGSLLTPDGTVANFWLVR